MWKKTTVQIPNNFIIIKSITIILVYVSRLKKNLSYFSLLSHTHTKGLFGFSVSITNNSVSITHNSKLVGPTTE